ncbi:MAG: hypothetical protein ACI4PO_09300 [Faecousia sp.]
MTINEMTERFGSEENADYVTGILIKNVKPDFIRLALRAEVAEIEAELKTMEQDGWIYSCNGTRHVNWAKADKLNGWNLPPEQEAAYDEARKKCNDASALLYRLNRTTSMLARA